MRMMPYMYKYTKDAYDTGAPVVRGMIWNYPQDRKTWDRSTQYQYMLGDWLLVAPVFTSMKVNKGWRKEDIYLPAGQWIDYWDGRRVNGPATLDAYPVTLEKLPLLVKAGAIIPLYPEMLYNDQKPKDPLTLDIYPYGNTQFEMYEDDGNTRKYQRGEFATQLIQVKAPEGKAGDIEVLVGKSVGEFAGKLNSRVYELLIHSEVKPRSITVNGQPVLELTDPGAYPNAMAAWYDDRTDRQGIIHVKLARASTDHEIRVNLDLDENQVIAASPPYPVPVVTPELDKTEFTVTSNSQQGGDKITNAFDGKNFAAAAEFDLTRDLNAAPLPDEVTYLSDREPASVKGEFKKGLSIGGKPITVNGQTYNKGLGVQAASELVYKLRRHLGSVQR